MISHGHFRVLDELEEITDTLKSMAPEDSDDFESETYMSGLLDALADVWLSHPTEAS